MVRGRRALRTLLQVCALALLTLAGAVSGAPGSLTGTEQAVGAQSQQKPAGAQTPTSQADAAKDLEQRLAEAKAELDAISTPGTLSAGAPPGTSESELLARRERLATLVGIYRMQIAREADLSDLKARHAAPSSGEVAWPPPLQGPPYSYVAVDELRETARTLKLAVRTHEAALTALARESDVAQQRWNRFEESARQLTEALQGNPAAEQRGPLQWQLDQAQLGTRVAGASLAMINQETKLTEERQAYDLDRLTPVQAALALTSGKVRFTKAELDQALGELTAARERLDSDLEAASRANADARATLQAAEQALQAAHPKASDDSPLQRAHALASVRSENTEAAVRALLIRKMALDRQAEVWQHRWLLANASNADAVVQAQNFLAQERRGIEALRPFLEERLDQVRDQISEHDFLARHAPAPEEAQYKQQMLEAYRERGEAVGNVLQSVGVYDHMLERWGEEVGERIRQRSLFERVRDVATAARDLLRQGWDFELLAVESTIQVEGQTITGQRSITVGKVVRVIFILVLGYWLSQWLARRVEGAVVTRFKMDASRARVARRWAETLGLIALIIFALAWVQIPLTVFAFLGGAVAIGAGFGMQTALKNLISGLMILFERPFRPGDLIEVGSIRGRVTEIGVRSSVVRDAQGIETLIPNSTLVEQNVTNWTYTSPHVRFSVKVGVAYGSPTRRVSEILATVAGRHPRVLASPEPFVVFEDFAADALLFSLDFWVEVKPGVEARVVAGEIRHLIDEALREAGIAIAFPQRDVHLDAARPLPVHLVQDPGGAPSG